MNVEEYLKTSKLINISEIARKMYPGNKDAPSYLLRKLSGKDRPFTVKDAKLAYDVLKALGEDLIGVTEQIL